MIAKPTLHSHTHCQVAQTKACQRMCLSECTGDAALLQNCIQVPLGAIAEKQNLVKIELSLLGRNLISII